MVCSEKWSYLCCFSACLPAFINIGFMLGFTVGEVSIGGANGAGVIGDIISGLGTRSSPKKAASSWFDLRLSSVLMGLGSSEVPGVIAFLPLTLAELLRLRGAWNVAYIRNIFGFWFFLNRVHTLKLLIFSVKKCSINMLKRRVATGISSFSYWSDPYYTFLETQNNIHARHRLQSSQ